MVLHGSTITYNNLLRVALHHEGWHHAWAGEVWYGHLELGYPASCVFAKNFT